MHMRLMARFLDVARNDNRKTDNSSGRGRSVLNYSLNTVSPSNEGGGIKRRFMAEGETTRLPKGNHNSKL